MSFYDSWDYNKRKYKKRKVIKTLRAILENSIRDVIVTERMLVNIKGKTSDLFSGAFKYYCDTQTIEAIDEDTYSLDTEYCMYQWHNLTELTVWLDCTSTEEE